MTLPDVLCCFLTGHSAYYSKSFRKDTCYIKHPRMSKNILNKICAFDFSENRGENVKHHPRKMTKNSALD